MKNNESRHVRMALTRRRKIILAVAAAPVALYLLAAGALVWTGLADDASPADAAVVPGNTVEPDGRPSGRLRSRLEKALDLYRRGLVKVVIVSGAVGAEGWDEAVVMKRFLVERGVPEDRIHADGEGRNTFLTARNARRFLDGRGLTSAIAVSQYFHVPRTRLALRRCGVATVYGAHADYFEWRDLYATVREVAAFGAYLLRPAEPTS